jgi:hypothetical protein
MLPRFKRRVRHARRKSQEPGKRGPMTEPHENRAEISGAYMSSR